MKKLLLVLVAGMMLVTPAGVASADETNVFLQPSVHYVLLGIARSYDASFMESNRDYAFGWMGVSLFPFRVDDGRMLLGGFTLSYASRIPTDDSTTYLAFVPAAFRVCKPLYVAVTLGRTKSFDRGWSNNVGVQLSFCLAGCKQ